MNFHTEIAFAKMLSSFMPGASNSNQIMENFTDNVDDLVSAALEEAKIKFYAEPSYIAHK